MTTTATQIGIFFDGTGNNMDNDIPNGNETNVAKLFGLYNTETYTNRDNIKIAYIRKKYIRGVGSTIGTKLVGGVTGIGAHRRLTKAYNDVKKHLDKDALRGCETVFIDVVGFSRGASLARHFVNMIKNLGVTIGDTEDKYTGIEVRFLGIFDTVASFGLPGNDTDLNLDFNVDPNYTKRCVHIVAEHERRSLFDLQSIKASSSEALANNFTEFTCPGAHADVGGGYEYTPERQAGWYKERIVKGVLTDVPESNKNYENDFNLTDDAVFAQQENEEETYYLSKQEEKSNELSRIPLKSMYAAMLEAGINMTDLNAHPRYESSIKITDELQTFYDANKQDTKFEEAIASKYIHDSRYATDKLKEKLPGGNKVREVYYSQAKPITWKKEKEIMAGEWDNYDEECA